MKIKNRRKKVGGGKIRREDDGEEKCKKEKKEKRDWNKVEEKGLFGLFTHEMIYRRSD